MNLADTVAVAGNYIDGVNLARSRTHLEMEVRAGHEVSRPLWEALQRVESVAQADKRAQATNEMENDLSWAQYKRGRRQKHDDRESASGRASAAVPGVFDVRKFGAQGNGKHLDTPHIQAAIDAAVAAGKGIVLLPSISTSTPTVYLSSGITLGSNIILRVQQGAILGSSRRWSDYPKVLVLATDCAPGPCLEYRRHPIVLFSSCTQPVLGRNLRCDQWNRVSNVTIDGGGEIHGEGDAWWNSEKYMHDAYQRPHTLFIFYASNVVIRDITLRRSPWWTVHILACTGVLVDNISIDAEVDFQSSVYPTNNVDGIDISSSQGVTIRNSEIKPGDDCVVVYALHPNEMQTRNITVQNVTCHTPFSIGNGDPGRMEFIEDVLFENCTVQGGLTPNDNRFKPRWWQTALRVKGNPGANSTVRNVTFRNIEVKDVDLVFDLAMHYVSRSLWMLVTACL